MKKVFSDKSKIIELWLKQTQYFAGTPICDIKGRGKGRRFYFKGDTIYSYRDDYPLAKIVNDIVFIKEQTYSQTTNKHKNYILKGCNNILVIYSDNLKEANNNDFKIEKILKIILYATKNAYIYRYSLIMMLKNEHQPITKSKFPILFEEKHNKIKEMFFSDDVETFNLAVKIIKQQKLV